MEYKKIDNYYIVRIDKGEEVIKSLTELCKKENVKLGLINGIGATDNVTIGLFDTYNKKYNSKTFKGPMEITSLIGNVSTMNNETYLHLHINVSDKDLMINGGHLNECYISATCEIIVTVINSNIDRKFNEKIGLNLINFKKRN